MVNLIDVMKIILFFVSIKIYSMQNEQYYQSETLSNTFSSEYMKQFSKVALREKLKNKQLALRAKYKEFKTYRTDHDSQAFYKSTEKQQLSENQLPSINEIRAQKRQINQQLRKTMNEYKFLHVDKERKDKIYQRVKHKYNRIKNIREQSQAEKTQLYNSRISLQEDIKQSKEKIRNQIYSQRKKSSISLQRIRLQKKITANIVRNQQRQNYETIIKEKKFDLLMRRTLKEKIAEEQIAHSQKIKQLQLQKVQRAQENYLDKFLSQLQQKNNLNIQLQKFKNISGKKSKQLQEVVKNLNRKIRFYKQQVGEQTLSPSRVLSFSTQV